MHMKHIRALALAVIGAGLTAPAAAQTVTLNPSDNLTAAIEAAAAGTTIQLNPGVYTPKATGPFPDTTTFAIGKNVRIVGLGATPADVRLSGGAGGDYAVKFFRYNITVPASTPPDPSGATLENLTVDTSPGGIQIFNFAASPNNSRLTGITIRNVVVNTKNPGTANIYGVLVKASDNIVLDGLTVNSYGSGFFLVDSNETLVMNSTHPSTGHESAAGLAILGGSKHRIINNVIGTAKASPSTDSGYSFLSDSIVIYNSSDNRIEGNVAQGHRDGGVSIQARSLVGTVPAPQDTARSLNNYLGKNNVVSTGFAAGREHGTGIWSNCSSNGTWLFGNISIGSAEAGLNTWLVRSNMAIGNSFGDNRLIGIGVEGGKEAPPFCENAAYRVKPTSLFFHSNYVYYNRGDQITVRNADTTELSRNFITPRNGFGGALQVCTAASQGFCQAAFSLETDETAASSTGYRIVANTNFENVRGLFNGDGKSLGVEFYMNRMISSTQRASVSRFLTGTSLTWDFGANIGGNYWDRHTAFGNPSASNPYSGVFHDLANNTGRIVDRYPYQTEDFGRGQNVTVYEPRVNTIAARGSRRAVRWNAPGCTFVDLLLDGSTALRSHTGESGLNVPNTGYAVVTIPDSASVAAHTIAVRCKDSAGNIKGSGTGPAFTVASADLTLLSPGRDDVFNAGETIFVAWKKAASVGAVTVEFSADGGATYSTLATGVTATAARVALPTIASTAYAMVKISSSTGSDTTDGVFAVRGASGAGFANVSPGRKFVVGGYERLEWASPQGSKLVDISATVNTSTVTVASNLPDRGNFDWVVGDMAAGNISLAITFKNIDGGTISSIPSTTAGTTALPTTITFGTTPSVSPGGTGAVSATANSGLAVTFTSLTPAVCTIAGTTVTGVASGSCTIAADQAGNGTYAAAPQTHLTFNVGTAQTITFGAAPLVVLNGTGTVTATATSGLAVTFSTLTPTVCIVSGSTVTGLATGTCTIAGNQSGNSSFSAAPQVTQTFTVVDATTIPRLVNISTRGLIATGDNIMIGGFVIGGSGNKQVVIRGRGPSLAAAGVSGVIADPAIRLFNGATPIEYNDNWQQAANHLTIPETFKPTNALEAALYTTVSPNVPYTVHVTGINGSQGIGIVEVFEADKPEIPLLNISTRGLVLDGDNVLIGGFIIQGNAAQQVLVVAKGPSLGQAPFNVPGALLDPKLEIYAAGNINPIHTNDNWVDAPNQAAIAASGNAPSSALESAIMVTLNPGAYTAIVKGVGAFQGVGLVEVYKK